MKLKTLFLGTAAAFAVTGGAQAADLALAVEPIDYVKVCDAFGTGYYYIPGTDTCLRIGGYVQMDVWFYDSNKVGNVVGFSDWTATGPYYTGSYVKDSYSQSWEFKSEAGVDFTAKSMSDLGPIIAFAEFRAKSNNDNWEGAVTSTKNAYADSFYGAIGPIMFGYTTSTFDPGGAYTDYGGHRSDKKADQLRLSYMMGTWGIMLGLEDPRDRYAGGKNATGDYPDIILALTGGVAGFDVKASVGVTDRTSGTGWGAALTAEADLGAGAKIKVAGSYSDNAKSFSGGSNCSGACNDGEWWSAFITGSVALSGNMELAGTASYMDAADSRTGLGEFGAALALIYHTSGNSLIQAEVDYTDPETGGDSWAGLMRFKTSFGG